MQTKTTCNYQADYSTITGERILPFVFTLNTEDSVLYPEEGEYQKFCYDIEGVGEDTSRYADLSHFLFGICSEITEEDFVSVTVTIDGVPQNVDWGENVEIKTEEKPDPTTGCVGLKFDFPLDKVDGQMEVCFTLRTPYAIGPMDVCLKGGRQTANGLAICGPVCGGGSSCESVFYQRETVCVPVTVTPRATPGTATAICCGDPVISTTEQCPGSRTSCTFTISQNICIEIPISFGALIQTGTAVVQCGTVSETPCDCDDDDESEAAPSLGSTPENATMRDRHFFNK